MKKIKFGDHVLPHLVAVITFLIVTLIFFSPVFFDNKALSQQDIDQYKGASKTLTDYREATGEEGLWTNSMFSGMPAYLVSLKWSDDAVVTIKKVLSLYLPHPVNNIFIAFISFYILLLAFRVRPYVAIAFALAYGLSTYLIIGLSVGHNARIGAVAFMPLVMAGIHLAFTGTKILGVGVTAAGLALQLRENHLQITYYLLLIVLAYGLVRLIIAIREKQLRDFLKTVMVLIPAVVLAVGTFFGQLWAITEYTRYSIRGPSELQNSNPNESGAALTKEYAFEYNYGIWEPMTLLIPEIYGGTSRKAFVQDQSSASYKALVSAQDNNLANQLAAYTSHYWGPQRSGTIGPYYAGAVVVFLFAVGIAFAERKYVLWLVPLAVLSLMLSWGDSFSTFNYFLFDHLPGYNKFRSVNFSLAIILFALPLLGALGLESFLKASPGKERRNKLLVTFISTGGLCLMLLLFAGMGTFARSGESDLPVWFLKALKDDRVGLLRSDAFRSFAFIAVVFLLMLIDIPKKITVAGFGLLLALVVTIDLAAVNKRYFTKDNYHRKRGHVFFEANAADQEILKDKSHYRVYNLQDPWAEARTSYFHRSLGGYHGAKLRRYKDLYDSAVGDNTQQFVRGIRTGAPDFNKLGVLNMLNAKYFVYGPDRDNVILNPSANGVAWFVRGIVPVSTPTEELQKVEQINTKDVAVIDQTKFTTQPFQFDSMATITMVDIKPPTVKYESNSSVNGIAVFSEIYYPKGWHAFVDGTEVPILRANYVLRALEVPAGKHTIEFKFEPKPYVIGNKITLASSWILILVLAASLGFSVSNVQGPTSKA